MATNAAIPNTIEEINRLNRPRFRRLSRHAIFSSQEKDVFCKIVRYVYLISQAYLTMKKTTVGRRMFKKGKTFLKNGDFLDE
ncbi:MAG: hypothetical protein ACJAYJ_001505 [Saprospiraceae bacterium]|jgi:hypothetical protein